MAEDFYPFVDPTTPAPDNTHLTGAPSAGSAPVASRAAQEPAGARPGETTVQQGDAATGQAEAELAAYATRISVYDDMFSTPHVIVIDPAPVRPYLEEVTNTVYRLMKEQGGSLSLMVIREIVENFIHAHFVEPIISILDGGNTIRFADQGPGIGDKERAFEFGVTSADRSMKRYIRGTGSGLPMVQQYLEAAGGAISIENNLGGGTVVTVSTDAARVAEIKRAGGRGAAVRPGEDPRVAAQMPGAGAPAGMAAGSAGTAAGMMPAGAGAGVPDGAGAMTPAGIAAGMPGSPAAGAGLGVEAAYLAPGAYPPGYAGAYPPQNPYGAYPYPGYGTGAYAAGAYPAATWPGAEAAPGTVGSYPAQPYAAPGYPGADMAPVPGYPMPSAGFPQQGREFSTTAPYPGYPAATPQAAPGALEPVGELIVSDRGKLALSYLLEHGHAGPSELTEAYGQSGPTWSRELATLGKRGFTVKQGQKYYLTELGANWARAHA